MLPLPESTSSPLLPFLRGTLLAGSTLLLVACQSAPIERDYDTSRDFTQYRTWSWADTAVSYTPQSDPRVGSDLTTQRIREAVANELDARGLRPAGDGQPADLRVEVDVVSEEEEEQVTTTFGGSIGYGGWGGWGWGLGGGPAYTESRSVDYQMLTLQIDLRDADDGQLFWRGSDEEQLWGAAASPTERAQQIREMTSRILSGYPPY